MARNPIVLLHGYSDKGASYTKWRAALTQRDIQIKDINICNYVTLNNEITIDDIAEGFERGLQAIGLADGPFDVIVHSTGVLVVRSWLTATNAGPVRQGRLKRLIALAPATFGSPLAAKGRSLLGRIFKGSKDPGPDFLASGDRVLFGLELASQYTWDLAHKDMIEHVTYGPDRETPYVFVFDGTDDYGCLAEIFDHDDQVGTDGVVRWAGCALNTRKLTLDLSHTGSNRFSWSNWTGIDIPLIPLAGLNHGQILADPPDELIDLVDQALNVDSLEDFRALHRAADAAVIVRDGYARLKDNAWQQFVVRAVDSRGNPITDYSIEVFARDPLGGERTLTGFEEDVHTYTDDSSFGCFHVRLDDISLQDDEKLFVRIIASSGTDLVGYQGYTPGAAAEARPAFGPVEIDVTAYNGRTEGQPALFYPFTTTLIEIRLNREPIPLTDGRYEIFDWLRQDA